MKWVSFLLQVFTDVKTILEKEGWLSAYANTIRLGFCLFIFNQQQVHYDFVHSPDFLLLVTFKKNFLLNAALFECVCGGMCARTQKFMWWKCTTCMNSEYTAARFFVIEDFASEQKKDH